MNFTFKSKNSKKKSKSSTNENESKSSNATLKKALLQTIISLLSSLEIAILKTK